jgi:hypothetical protein
VHSSGTSPRGKNVIYPIIHNGVKVLSLGFVNPSGGDFDKAAIMRGPMASRLVNQLLNFTDWGDRLDILLLDMPPGTGDVHLTVNQSVKIDGSVVVTTPSAVAAIDAVKGVAMLRAMDIDVLAAVENMKWFQCEGGAKHYPFGKKSRGSEELGVDDDKDVFQLPIMADFNNDDDDGDANQTPKSSSHLVLDGEVRETFMALARTVATKLYIKHVAPVDELTLVFDLKKDAFVLRRFTDKGGEEKVIEGSLLMRTNPKTGDLGEEKGVSRMLLPATVKAKGNYGFEVRYANGAAIIYTNAALWQLLL